MSVFKVDFSEMPKSSSARGNCDTPREGNLLVLGLLLGPCPAGRVGSHGKPEPEIVGFESSVRFDRDYCR
jgi:hypothetical protein